LYGHPEPRQETGKGVAALTHNGLGGGGGPDDNLAQAGHLLAFDWQAGGDHTSSGAFKQDGSTPTLGTVGRLAFAQNQRDELRELEVASSVSAERWGTAKNETLVATVERTCDHAGCSRPVFPNSDSMFCEEHQECDEGLALSFRTNQTGAQGPIHSTEVTDTLAEDHPPAVISSSVRRLTPLECERLQGFPDGWTDIPGNSDTQRYRQLGNAVAVPVAEWIMRRL
jgi:site-specific DNA-cytosine methylase